LSPLHGGFSRLREFAIVRVKKKACLQGILAQTVRKLAVELDINATDRDQIMTFLSESSDADAAGKALVVVPILKHMHQKLAGCLRVANANEKQDKEKLVSACLVVAGAHGKKVLDLVF